MTEWDAAKVGSRMLRLHTEIVQTLREKKGAATGNPVAAP